ncbi:MAG: 3-deoxy-D-manno-octulosonic acid transferase [Pseudomonadota bacterium]
MTRSVTVLAYLGLAEIAMPIAREMVRRRLLRGKEDPERWRERLARTDELRPDGPLIWFHAASIGEALSIIDLVGLLLKEREGLNVLVTTGTVTSAAILTSRLPPRAIHQYVPVDAAPAVRRFLNHWRPDTAVWTESEIWPALIHHTHRRGCPMYLVNARISAKTASRLRMVRRYAQSLFGRFTRILAQDRVIAERLVKLGVSRTRIEVTGSLKESATPLPVDEVQLKELTQRFAGQPVWCAASTHPGEEDAVTAAHRYARRIFHHLILILVPRHPERGDEIAANLREEGWRVAQRSKGETIDRATDIYLADTIGELGLWYRLAPVSFVGGSLVRIGGHNPFEPTLLGSALLHGPYVANFSHAYDRFQRAGGAVAISEPDALGPAVVDALAPDRAAALAAAAWSVTSEGADVATRVCDMLLESLERAA